MKDWMWWFIVPAGIILVYAALAALGITLYKYPWFFYVLFALTWVGVLVTSKLGRSTILKLTAAGVVIGFIFGTVIAVISWLTGHTFNVRNIADFSFYFAVSAPVLFNLGYVKGKYGMP